MFQIGSCGYKNYRLYDNCRCQCNIAMNCGGNTIMDNAYTCDEQCAQRSK